MSSYGIEIEAEGVRDPFYIPEGHYEPDGSLRNNGMEYISTILPGASLAKAWHNNVIQKLQEIGASFSQRCGVHIHIDFREKSDTEVKDFIHKYLLMERRICSIIGHGRDKNTFCLPWLDNDGDFTYIKDYFTGRRRRSFLENTSKYTALNLRPLAYQGSIEFRMLPTIPDTNLFSQVVDIFEDLQNLTPTEVIEKYQISREDKAEAEAFFGNLNKTAPDENMEFLSEHFSVPVVTPQLDGGLTLDAVEQYMRENF